MAATEQAKVSMTLILSRDIGIADAMSVLHYRQAAAPAATATTPAAATLAAKPAAADPKAVAPP